MKKIYIPIVVADYGRNRGSDVSGKHFEYLIQNILYKPRDVLKNFYGPKSNPSTKGFFHMTHIKEYNALNPNIKYFGYSELEALTKSLISKLKILDLNNIEIDTRVVHEDWFKSNKDQNILFNFCMIQNPDHFGNYLLKMKDNDIVFFRGNNLSNLNAYRMNDNLYVQSMVSAKMSGSKFFPKYMVENIPLKFIGNKIENMYQRFKPSTKNNIHRTIRLGYYDRSDTDPIQTKIYKDYINELKNNPLYKDFEFKVTSFGSNDDIDRDKMNYILCNEIDIMLYTEPQIVDVYPNTIFQAIQNGCLILHIPNSSNAFGLANGIEEMKIFFKNKFVYSLDEVFKYFGMVKFRSPGKEITALKKVLDQKVSTLDLLVHKYIMEKINFELDKFISSNQDTLNGVLK